jgi:hypothetical protein
VTTSGIEHTIFRLVVENLNQLPYSQPPSSQLEYSTLSSQRHIIYFLFVRHVWKELQMRTQTHINAEYSKKSGNRRMLKLHFVVIAFYQEVTYISGF